MAESWLHAHDRWAQQVDRRDIELDAVHELQFAIESQTWFTKRKEVSDCV